MGFNIYGSLPKQEVKVSNYHMPTPKHSRNEPREKYTGKYGDAKVNKYVYANGDEEVYVNY